LNNAGYTRDIAPTLQGGTYSLVATYGGDSSFTGSTSAAHTFTITPASTQVIGPFFISNGLIGTPIVLNMQLTTTAYNGLAPGGTVSFYDGTTVLPGTVSVTSTPGTAGQYASLSASLSVNFTTTGPHAITAKYSGDANYAGSVSEANTLNMFYQTSTAEVVPSTAINYGQSVTVSATAVSPNKSPAMTGKLLFYPYSNPSRGRMRTAIRHLRRRLRIHRRARMRLWRATLGTKTMSLRSRISKRLASTFPISA
jgi:hypothetical protein